MVDADDSKLVPGAQTAAGKAPITEVRLAEIARELAMIASELRRAILDGTLAPSKVNHRVALLDELSNLASEGHGTRETTE